MGRAARAERAERGADRGGAAARVAARRRLAGRGRADAVPTRRARGSAGRGGVSRVARAFKMLVLIVAFLAIGFFGVLVIDVGASVVGQVRLGEVTVAGLWEKVKDRFLDNDVPRTPEPPSAAQRSSAPRRPRAAPDAPTPASPASEARASGGRASEARAPVPASRPEDDARHVDHGPRVDPQVERARRRLDALLERL